MNPYLIIAFPIALALSGAGGFKLGVDHEKAGQLDRQELLAAVADEAANTAARAIADLKPKYTTIQGKLEKTIETNTVYRDCRLDPVGMQLANQALNGGAQPSGGSELPKADAPAK